MTNPDYRYSAQQHLKAAKRLLQHKGVGWSRHACLELRMAIEALTYSNLQAYLSEVSNEAMKAWTPKKVIDELLAIDPHADESVRISAGIERKLGVPSNDMKYLGEDRRFSVKWANKAHNTLGSFLHEPTIRAYEQGKDISDALIRSRVTEVISELDEILSARIWGVNFGRFVEFDCKCNFRIRRKIEVLRNGSLVSCANCAMGYILTLEQDDRYRFEPDQVHYTCEGCGNGRALDAHMMHKLPLVVCVCGHRAKVSMVYELGAPVEVPDNVVPDVMNTEKDPSPETTVSIAREPILSRIATAVKYVILGRA